MYNDRWIQDNWDRFRNWKSLQEEYNRTMGTDYGYNTFKSHCNRELGLNFKYTKEQNEWLRQNFPVMGRYQCTKEFNEAFGEHRSVQGIKVHCVKLGLTVTKDRKKEAGFERAAWKSMPVGSVVKKAHGEPYVKTENGWKRVKCLIVKSQDPIVHLDGNPDNCNPENLMAVNRRIMVKMAKYKFWSENPEITKTGILCCELEDAIR